MAVLHLPVLVQRDQRPLGRVDAPRALQYHAQVRLTDWPLRKSSAATLTPGVDVLRYAE